MTAAGRASRKHVNSLERWFEKAKEANPNLTDEQAARLAEKMRLDHFRRMGRLSGEARKLAGETQAELERAGSVPAESAGTPDSLARHLERNLRRSVVEGAVKVT